MGHVQASRLIAASVEEVFQYVTDLGQLPRSLGPEIRVDFPAGKPALAEQVEFPVVFSRLGMSARSVLRVEEIRPQERLAYRQVSGFFRSWSHVQTLREHDAQTTLLSDLIDFRLPMGFFGALIDDLLIRKDLENTLNLRLARIDEHFTSTRRNRA